MDETDRMTALSRGFDAGNYANAYTSEDLDTAWEAEEEEIEESEDDERKKWIAGPEYRAGFVVGFFGSYEDHEVSDEHLDELLSAAREYADMAKRAGIAWREENDGGDTDSDA